jgi:hypothetical protein
MIRNRFEATWTRFFELDSPKVKRLKEYLLGFLDDMDPNPTILDLDFVMKSFEEEISLVCTSSPVPVVELSPNSSESQPKLK